MIIDQSYFYFFFMSEMLENTEKMKKHKIARFGAKLEPDFNLPKLNLELGEC